jgi:peptide/nickel transport system ATP-binding protein/oligopeptide transport system ATP-binding protein
MNPLLEVKNLKVHFPVRSGLLQRVTDQVRAVDGVDFSVGHGEIVGLVGESGSGKSTIGKTLVKLLEPTEGGIFYQGENIGALGRSAFFPYRKRIQMVFQDPYNSLNPRMTVSEILSEPLEIHFKKLDGKARRGRCLELLEQVGLKAEHIGRYPHEFSGGQRQRIGIARALAVEPEFLVLDEPVSALDVSVQAQIINLLKDLQQLPGRPKLTYLFISHDLAVVEHLCSRVLVMNAGKIVEQGDCSQVLENPREEYTCRLLEAARAF